MSGLPAGLAGLLHPQAYPHAVHDIVLVETPISWVLLTGEFAYKIKRPVRYPFVDLRSRQRRAFLCQEEVRLNRRFAADLYLGTSPICLEGTILRVGGAGEPIETAVRMRQFDRSEELDRLLEDDRVDPAQLAGFGEELADIHSTMPIARAADPWGQPDAVAELLRRNLEECIEAIRGLNTRFDAAAGRAALDERLEAARDWLAERRSGAHVRECHGDLHCGNIVRLSARLTPFDCIEFEPAFRWIDVADEIGFVIADMEARGRALHAHAFLSGYLERSGDYGACTHLGLYKAHRSWVRAKVEALRAQNAPEGTEASRARQQCCRYLECAPRFLAPRRGALILMYGLSGSGKTWLARRLAPELSAVHLRSDIERNRPSVRHGADSDGTNTYADEQRRRIYLHLAESAKRVIEGGYTVLVDATFQSRQDRALFRDLACELKIEPIVIHCQAPDTILVQRIQQRAVQGGDRSQATVEVLHQQQRSVEAITPAEGLRVIEAMTTDPNTLASIVRQLGVLRSSGAP
jgi:uncharacterized protein